jgi:polyphosphate kinase 2 (PPK2 family)
MAKEQNSNDEKRLKKKQYEKELRRLQEELCKLQDWIKYKGLRVMVVFEGRDAQGREEPSAL